MCVLLNVASAGVTAKNMISDDEDLLKVILTSMVLFLLDYNQALH